jgi:hypothetical protein
MKIITEQYCNLARSKNFQNFLRSVSPDLFKNLIKQLQKGEGCNSNKNKMIEIQEELKSRGLINNLLDFLLDKYPNMVIKDTNNKKDNKFEIKRIIASSAEELYDKMNYHKVFEKYRPKILTIPQQYIILGPTKQYVLNKINSFIRNKIDVDYIVLKGPELWHGYVEYFNLRFKNHLSDIQHNHRPIHQYKKSMNITT